MRLSRIITYDKEKMRIALQVKQETLTKMKEIVEAFETKEDPLGRCLFIPFAIFCREFKDVWLVLEGTVGSIFELRSAVVRITTIIEDSASLSKDENLKREVQVLKKKMEEYEPTFIELKKTIDRITESEGRREEASKRSIV